MAKALVSMPSAVDSPHLPAGKYLCNLPSLPQTPQSSRSSSSFKDGATPTVKLRRRPVRLDDFELIRVVGKGCAGRVLLVKCSANSRVYAMKAISKRSVLAYDELRHTLAEAMILRKFALEEPRNPFIAKLHHSFTDRENFYIVMDFYPGGDLATQMERGILGHLRTRFYAVDLVQGLEDLHRHGIIVRDLKPENILLNRNGHAVLADFGLSKDFGYRGEPRPLHVVTYPGQGTAPPWAGRGAASLRTNHIGQSKLVVDRAYSFVGTAEYLAPEVVKRGEYSYAVDWWALGCIVLEGLIGRVPFLGADEDSQIDLYSKILSDPWDDVFRLPRFKNMNLDEIGMDEVTWHFIDSLLIKDPMWRLTEPCIKSHAFFGGIDWNMVKRGEYADPYDLLLHPVQEFSTYYFPKLCLDQEPTVDMTSHDGEFLKEHNAKVTLDDDRLYMLEQAKYKRELESFTWSMKGIETMSEESSVMEEAEENDDTDDSDEVAIHDALDADLLSRLGQTLETVPEQDRTLQEALDTFTPEAYASEPAPTGEPADARAAVELDDPSLIPVPRSNSADDLSVSSPGPPLITKGFGSGSVTVPSSPRPINKAPPKRPVEIDRRSREFNLPDGLPRSGLSVSDIVAIPSPDINSPGRLVRRHKPMPSVDSVPMSRLSVDLHGTITNLGDEDWEELENLEPHESVPNVPHYYQNSFFSRVLKRRPSGLVSSGLRRQSKNSDSSLRMSSPTKARNPIPVMFGKMRAFPRSTKVTNAPSSYVHPRLHSPTPELEHTESEPAQSPVPREQSQTSQTSQASQIRLPERQHEVADPAASARPASLRRTTEPGWFDKRPRLVKHHGSGMFSSTRSLSAKLVHRTHDKEAKKGIQRSVSVLGSDRDRVPRLELTESPPILWDLDVRD